MEESPNAGVQQLYTRMQMQMHSHSRLNMTQRSTSYCSRVSERASGDMSPYFPRSASTRGILCSSFHTFWSLMAMFELFSCNSCSTYTKMSNERVLSNVASTVSTISYQFVHLQDFMRSPHGVAEKVFGNISVMIYGYKHQAPSNSWTASSIVCPSTARISTTVSTVTLCALRSSMVRTAQTCNPKSSNSPVIATWYNVCNPSGVFSCVKLNRFQACISSTGWASP
mmetsp:Transcript_5864/g.13662  ORF Transcript_5864/g.13662 Transcript_5864/m.13662 type:complete len:226 (-) Transcript_5864:815-1492(-)